MSTAGSTFLNPFGVSSEEELAAPAKYAANRPGWRAVTGRRVSAQRGGGN
ncbi:MAG: hypothetical protein ABIS06_20925 [Vicinamibacterales bacterium]